MPQQVQPIPFFQLRTLGGGLWPRQPHIPAGTYNIDGDPVNETGTFSELYCNKSGSNINAGSTSGAAVHSFVSGNWNGSTTYTVQDGTNPTTWVAVGDFVSVYPNGTTVAVYIARVSAVQNLTNGTITINSSAAYGTAPSLGTGTVSLTAGGAWAGPNGASIFPFGLAGNMYLLQNVAGNKVRINFKNDQVYATSTNNFLFNTATYCAIQGYRSIPGDGGRALLTSNSNNGGYLTTGTGGNITFADLIFENTAATNTQSVFQYSGSSGGSVWRRCVFRGGYLSGFRSNQVGMIHVFIECEAHNNNRSNGASKGGWESSSGCFICINCYSHDNGTTGWCSENATKGDLILINCVADTNAGYGVNVQSSQFAHLVAWNCDFYNNTIDAIRIAPSATLQNDAVIVNNNFIKNGGKAVNSTAALQGGVLYNNARGAGTQANGSSDTLNSVTDAGTGFSYPANATPYRQPGSGNFSLISSLALNAGRGAFTESGGGKSGTVGFPDVGAGQAQGAIQSWAGSDIDLPTGYLNYSFTYDWLFSSPATITLLSGSLPPGLTLTQVGASEFSISGTPTAIGSYSVVLRATSAQSIGDATFNLTILDDPDQGIGGMIGG